MKTPEFVHVPAARRRPARGFTLIETLVAVGVVSVLSSVAWPSFEGQLLKSRRLDGLGALMNAQLAEERHRSDAASYGTLAEIGVAATSSGGHYALQVASAGPAGFELVASATGRQQRDVACRYLRLTANGGQLAYASGADATVANAADANRACWSR